MRHGQTDYNRDRKWQGQIDVPLNDHGRGQARQLTQYLTPLKFDHYWASDLDRAHETAVLATDRPHNTWQVSAQLREMSFGNFEGYTYDQIVAAGRTDIFDAWQNDPTQFAMPGGETFAQVIDRVRDWIDRVVPIGRTLAVAHGGTIRAAMALADPSMPWDSIVENGSVTVMRVDTGATIVAQNVVPQRDVSAWTELV